MFMIFTYLFLDGLLNWLHNVVAFSLLHLGGVCLHLFLEWDFLTLSYLNFLGLFISYAFNIRSGQCL